MQNWDATGNASRQHSIGFDVEVRITLTVPHDCTGLHKPSSHANVDEKILSVYADHWKVSSRFLYFKLIGAYSLYSVIITCLILASKFYLETENVVVNADIGKFIKYRQAMIVAENKINDYPSDQEIMNYS